jgi:hypothetical protein
MPIAIVDSATIPRERRAELESAMVAAGKQSSKQFEGWIVAAADRREFSVRITSYPEVDISVPFVWNATAAEVTERVRAGWRIDAHKLSRNARGERRPGGRTLASTPIRLRHRNDAQDDVGVGDPIEEGFRLPRTAENEGFATAFLCTLCTSRSPVVSNSCAQSPAELRFSGLVINYWVT